MLRGRIVSVGGVAGRRLEAGAGAVRLGAAGRSRHHLLRRTLPKNSSLVAGDLVAGRSCRAAARFHGRSGRERPRRRRSATALVVNVLGRTGRRREIANLRQVDWESLAHQFRHGVLAGRLHRRAAIRVLTTLTPIGRRRSGARGARASCAMPGANSRRSPAVRVTRGARPRLRHPRAIDACHPHRLVGGGRRLGAGARRRTRRRPSRAALHDAVILKTLGATRRQLIAAFSLEYGLLGLATAIFGVLAGSLAALRRRRRRR